MLTELLERNLRHVEGLPVGHFDRVQEGQSPRLVTVCCSDSRVPAEGMWDTDEPGWTFTSEVIGSQVWDQVDGQRVLHGNLVYPLHVLGVPTVAVVGHTGCGAIAATRAYVEEGAKPEHPGLAKHVELLAPGVREALEEATEAGRTLSLDQLVEENVHRQVDFLLDDPSMPEGVEVLGFVYDLHGRYRGPRGKVYLVNAGGLRDPAELADQLPGHVRDAARSLLRS